MYAKIAEVSDFNSYYLLKCDKNNIYWSGHSDQPDKERLFNWYQNNIKRNDRFFFLFYNNKTLEEIYGYLYIDLFDKSDIVENSYGVNSLFTGKGIGTQILSYGINFALQKLPQINYIQCWIMTDNFASLKMVDKLNFGKTDEYKNYTTTFGEEKKMRKYLLKLKRE